VQISRNPIDDLTARVRADLGASFIASHSLHTGIACEPIDVMGGFSADVGSTIVSTIRPDRFAAIAFQKRDDRQVQVFSFDRYDDHKPFTLMASVDGIGSAATEAMRAHFQDANTGWAAIAIGAIRVLASRGEIQGCNIAIRSTTDHPAAHAVAIMRAMGVAESEVTKTAQDACDQFTTSTCPARGFAAVTRATGRTLLCQSCQPNSASEIVPLAGAVGIGVIDIQPDESAWARQQQVIGVASAMGHRLILEKIRQMGVAAGKQMLADPLRGQLANLPLNDYRRYFRAFLPETLRGGTYLIDHHPQHDPQIRIALDAHYPVQAATDFHIFGAHRVQNFIDSLRAASIAADPDDRDKELNKAGHLLYAAHASLASDAGLIDPAADEWVEKIRRNELAGYYGAGIASARHIVYLHDLDAASTAVDELR
jgi:hypothetical protein